MTCRLMVECDFDGCDASAEVVGRNASWEAIAEPILSEETRGVWESEWTNLPAGWVFVTGGERCPQHAGLVSALSSAEVPNGRRSDGE